MPHAPLVQFLADWGRAEEWLMDDPSPRRFRPIRWIAGAVLGICAAVALLVWLVLTFPYAKGARVGYLEKFSRKGWVCKTWEGELAMETMPGRQPEKFYFSTRSDPIAAQVNSALGKRVRVQYAHHKLVPSSCFGDTEFFVAGVEPVQ
jgi:hypothetical protein